MKEGKIDKSIYKIHYAMRDDILRRGYNNIL